ncbi:MAG: metallophosphoesterase [Ferruginibacter sp.]|nr:metallophosphoesterase [Ferruginibacter sp.]
MNRKEFLYSAASLTVLLTGGKVSKAIDVETLLAQKIKLRFVVASDGHYGEKNTPYEEYFKTLVNNVNHEHQRVPFQCCIINGDIVHDDKHFYPAAKAALDRLEMKYYVSQGNHDHVSPQEWKSIWAIPVNYYFKIKRNTFLIATTSNEAGTYLCPDLAWLEAQLKKHHRQENVFIFLHINPGKLTKYGVECPQLFELLAKYKNVKAIFNGHDHDEEGVKIKQDIPFLFDAHFGGSWGTSYRGYRVVELTEDNSIITYVMNPLEKINEAKL